MNPSVGASAPCAVLDNGDSAHLPALMLAMGDRLITTNRFWAAISSGVATTEFAGAAALEVEWPIRARRDRTFEIVR